MHNKIISLIIDNFLSYIKEKIYKNKEQKKELEELKEFVSEFEIKLENDIIKHGSEIQLKNQNSKLIAVSYCEKRKILKYCDSKGNINEMSIYVFKKYKFN